MDRQTKVRPVGVELAVRRVRARVHPARTGEPVVRHQVLFLEIRIHIVAPPRVLHPIAQQRQMPPGVRPVVDQVVVVHVAVDDERLADRLALPQHPVVKPVHLHPQQQ